MTDPPELIPAEELIREIEAAFQRASLGSGVSLQVARALDDYASEAEVSALRQCTIDRRWQDIPDEEIEQFSDVLPFMDAEGFRFHIPAFMTYALRTYEEPDHQRMSDPGVADHAIYALDLNDRSPELHDYQKDKYRLFSGRQKMAVAHFLAFFSQAEDCADSAAASHALEALWSRYLNAGE